MGSGETATPSKAAPKASSAQEQTPATTSSPATTASATAVVYPDWSGFQAYSPVPPHGFFPSVVSSPQTHPYMWGAQNIMTPYGTPPPPFVMYPHGGLYVHPSMPPGSHPFSPYVVPSLNGNPEASGSALEMDSKSSEDKEGSNLKRSNGSLGSLSMLTGKNSNEMGKTSGVSANGAFSQSGESGSEGSSEGSDAESENDSQQKTAADASQNGSAARSSEDVVAHTPSQGTVAQPMSMVPMLPAAAPGGVAGPTTNLNIGMEYWSAPTLPQIAPVRGKVHNAPVGGVLVPSGQNIPPELWLQDERELKRERRKQSNRESARRSRMRKQAECEELAQRVETLKEENTILRAEVSRVRKEYEQLLSENNSLKERIGDVHKGTEDSRLGRSEQHSTSDDREGHLDSDAQASQKDLAHSSH